MEKQHMVACGCSIVSLPCMGSRANAGPAGPGGHRGRGHLQPTHLQPQGWWAARIKELSTNDLTRGSICLQDQYAAIDSCAVSRALDVSETPTGNPQTRKSVTVAPHNLTSMCTAASAETTIDGSQISPATGDQ